MNKEIVSFFNGAPTAFSAVRLFRERLLKEGYEDLTGKDLKVRKGGRYFLTRNNSTVMAFRCPSVTKEVSLHITASHTDCPLLKLKPKAVHKEAGYVCLNTEMYGGPIASTWFDRPLRLSGRVLVSKDGGVEEREYLSSSPVGIIPSVAPHLSRDADLKFNAQKDLRVLVSDDPDYELEAVLAEDLQVKKEDILSFDLFLSNHEGAYFWGKDNEFFSSSHLDDLECTYTAFEGFLESENREDNVSVWLAFDNEEVGSRTMQGADSDLLENTLKKIASDLKLSYTELLDRGFMLSCDNAQGIHPNHPELSDPENHAVLNKGVVIKYNASQSYTSDGLGSALLKKLMDDHRIPYQVYTNRSDQRGGSTMGNISLSHVSVVSVDIGLAMLAMHSSLETA